MPRIGRRAFLAGAASLLAVPTFAKAALLPEFAATRRTIEVNGKAAQVYGIEGPAGFSGLSLMKGEPFRLRLRNDLSDRTLIHWHGLTPPPNQDGMPMLSQPPLKPGEAYDYDFANTRTGTHWMHSHVGPQEQLLLAAPLIVRDLAEIAADEQEHVVMLHDFTFRDPEEIITELRAGSGGHAAHAAPEADHGAMGHTASVAPMLNDIAYDAYLANLRTLADPEIVRVERSGRIRLRIINGAAASNMWIDLGTLTGELIAVDGNPIEPVSASRFPLAVAQRADIRLRLPADNGIWPVLFLPEGTPDRTGLILATPGANVAKLAVEGDPAPPLDLAMEASLRAAAPLAPEPASLAEMLMLTGGGKDYSWGFNGKPSRHETLFTVKPVERVELMLHNMTAMAHPMHLHGHHFQVVAIGRRRFTGAMRDTVLVPPGAAVTIAFDANNPGNWAFHCHHIYHMISGMMGTMAYQTAA